MLPESGAYETTRPDPWFVITTTPRGGFLAGNSPPSRVVPILRPSQPLVSHLQDGDDVSETHMPVSRRRFCTSTCQAASGAALTVLIPACSGGSASPAGPSSTPSRLETMRGEFNGGTVRIMVGTSALANIGGAVLVESVAGVFLVARTDATAFSALDAVCTHQSCTITGQDGSTYVCPCHGSRYTRTGQVVGGPAPASLRRYATTFADGALTIAL